MANDSKSNLGSRNAPFGGRSQQSSSMSSSESSNLGSKITVIPRKGKGIKKSSNVNMVKVLIVAVVVILLIAGAAFLLLGGSGTTVITTNKTLGLNAQQAANFQIGSSKSVYAIYLSNSTNGSVLLMLGKSPVLLSPAYKFRLQKGNIENVSTNNSANANLQVKLISSTSAGATLLLTVIPPDFGVKTSSGITLINGSAATTTTTTTPPPTNTTHTSNTTKTSNTTTTNTTTKKNTTTTNTSSGSTLSVQQKMEIANSTEYGQLMANLKALYIADQGCNENTYNNTYISIFYSEPSGPETFQNASAVTPTNINFAIVPAKGTKYEVVYTASGISSNNATLLKLGLDSAATSPVVNATFGGLFTGETYSDINGIYQTQVSRGGVCSAYVP